MESPEREAQWTRGHSCKGCVSRYASVAMVLQCELDVTVLQCELDATVLSLLRNLEIC